MNLMCTHSAERHLVNQRAFATGQSAASGLSPALVPGRWSLRLLPQFVVFICCWHFVCNNSLSQGEITSDLIVLPGSLICAVAKETGRQPPWGTDVRNDPHSQDFSFLHSRWFFLRTLTPQKDSRPFSLVGRERTCWVYAAMILEVSSRSPWAPSGAKHHADTVLLRALL